MLLTGFYGNPDASKREKSWDFLKELKPQEGIAWCVVGDFNEIISQDEKVGGRERSEGQMTRFREGLEWAGLYDMGWIGNKFTWSNGHEDHTFIKERLDRGVANQRWMCRFMERMVEILGTQVSDHKALVLTVGGLAEVFQQNRNFKYEMSWGMEDECSKIIMEEWEKDRNERRLLKKMQKLLTGCRRALKQMVQGINKG